LTSPPLDGDRGAVTAVELVLITPLFLVLLVFVVFCGRMGRTAHVVRAVAASAARAASLERSPGAAAAAARAVTGTPSDGDLSCDSPDVSFGSDGGVDTVTVKVRCTASLAGLSLVPVGGSHTFSYSATEPLDAYRGG
jgi:Flp pilus assembly protein TadG